MRHQKTLLALALSAWILPGLACGPSFPPDLLSDRAGTLLELPEGMFATEAARLVKPADQLRETVREVDWSLPDEQQFDPETDGLSPEQKPLVAQMREAGSAAEAAALGQALPPAVRLYTAGAVAWHQGEWGEAQGYFQAVLDLPEADRALRVVWAEFMLGRLRLQDGDVDGAKAHFQRTRELRAAGAPDPHELAIGTWGTESAWYLAQDQIPAAVAGYAEQAARGSDSGRASLLIVARRLLREPELLAASISDPLVQKLVSAYAFTRSAELVEWDSEAEDETAADDEAESDEAESEADAEPSASPSQDATAVDRVIAAADAAGLTSFAGADRLAAAAYEAGRYAQAERFLKLAEGPLATWVQAKLKLRGGDKEAAAALLAQASGAFAPDEVWNDPNQYLDYPASPHCRIEGEQAVLKLARGEFILAAEHLFAAGKDYWSDLAYVAERVLSVDELVALTTRLAPNYVPPKPQSEDESYENWPLMADSNVGNLLRYLTARRLLRVGKGEQALTWFDRPELKPKAQKYVALLKTAGSGETLERARALAEAADLARRDGMELLGLEGDPDYQLYAGSFDLNDPTTYDADYNAIYNPRSDLKLPPDYTSPEEKSRLEQSRAQPLERFHYRYVAAAHASAAADLVPPRSQAFAALLCKATAYVVYRNPPAAAKIYRRYLDEGAFVPWGAAFGVGDSYGGACPAPDFDRVAAQQRAARIVQLKRIAKLSALPLLALIGGGLGLFWWRRRKLRGG